MIARLLATTLSIFLIFLPGCSAYQAREELDRQTQAAQQRAVGWYEAQSRLVKMCTGPQRRSDCARRYVKESPWTYEVDDWAWVVMPSYTTIVDVHDEEIRKRNPTPPLYIEYTIGAARYLAERTDRGELTPEGFRQTFNKVWVWMRERMREHEEILLKNVSEEEATNKRTQETIATIGAGLAVVLGAALVAAAASASTPAPVTNVYQAPPPVVYQSHPRNCDGYSRGGYVRVQCY